MRETLQQVITPISSSTSGKVGGHIRQVNANYRPRSEQSARDRALFFSTAIAIYCARTIRTFISHCEESSDFAVEVPDDIEGMAVKELASVIILLTLIEQSESRADWLRAFAQECWTRLDRNFVEPKSAEVLSVSAGLESFDLCQITSMTLCHKMGLGATTQDASLYLGEILEAGVEFRSELLVFALAAPLTQLDNYIAAAS